MIKDSFGFFDDDQEHAYTREEMELRYMTARLDYLRSRDDISKFFHSTDVLFFRRIGKFTPKELGQLRARAYEMLRPHTN